eukprot:gene4902-34669_t
MSSGYGGGGPETVQALKATRCDDDIAGISFPASSFGPNSSTINLLPVEFICSGQGLRSTDDPTQENVANFICPADMSMRSIYVYQNANSFVNQLMFECAIASAFQNDTGLPSPPPPRNELTFLTTRVVTVIAGVASIIGVGLVVFGIVMFRLVRARYLGVAEAPSRVHRDRRDRSDSRHQRRHQRVDPSIIATFPVMVYSAKGLKSIEPNTFQLASSNLGDIESGDGSRQGKSVASVGTGTSFKIITSAASEAAGLEMAAVRSENSAPPGGPSGTGIESGDGPRRVKSVASVGTATSFKHITSSAPEAATLEMAAVRSENSAPPGGPSGTGSPTAIVGGPQHATATLTTIVGGPQHANNSNQTLGEGTSQQGGDSMLSVVVLSADAEAGASQSQIGEESSTRDTDKLPSPGGEEDESRDCGICCAVCIEDYIEGEEECVDQWMGVNNTCPFCRYKLCGDSSDEVDAPAAAQATVVRHSSPRVER